MIVTSGAVGVGCQRLGLKTRPTELAKKQALAAVGQVHLMKFYEGKQFAASLRYLFMPRMHRVLERSA